jgi:hypothetical protein
MANGIQDALKDLYDEIHAAIHAMLSQEFSTDLYWTSVGLLNKEKLSTWWLSHVNEHYKNICGDDGHPLCNTGHKCQTLNGFDAPPCITDHIDKVCTFREALTALEQATMQHGSNSLGFLSREYFFHTGGKHPYISPEAMPNCAWIKQKSTIISELGLTEGNDATYNEAAGKCMPIGTTVALVPLVQSHLGRHHYVGAVVICANTESKIWMHLPRIKAVALPLTEAHRHLVSLTASQMGDPVFLDLLRTLS